MIDNLELIKPLLEFKSPDDFYYLQILQRKKENSELGSNSRVIKNYYIKSIEHLELRYQEIKDLCILFNARASIRLNRRSFEKVAFKTLQNIANSMSNKEYSFINKSYDRACGLGHNDKNKSWIIDIDKNELPFVDLIIESFQIVEPFGDKLITKIPSKTGIHLITKPFNVLEFTNNLKKHVDIHLDIQKDNPTNLFIP
jgi:hypothetical protein